MLGKEHCWRARSRPRTRELLHHRYAREHAKSYEPEPCVHAPVAVATTRRFTAISAGNRFTCALAHDGKAYCWGSRSYGHVGAGDRTHRHPEVVAVDAPAPFTQISADGSLACGLSNAGDIYCWGRDRSSAATRVFAPVHFSHVSRGFGQTCAITTDGRAWCWGSNHAGELGTGAQANFAGDPVPRAVSGTEPFAVIDAGFLSTCVIATSGALYCWGSGSVLGAAAPDQCFNVDAFSSCALAPVRVSLEHVTAVVGGAMHRCALVAGGALYCWGSNEAGAFGDGTRNSTKTPRRVRGEAN